MFGLANVSQPKYFQRSEILNDDSTRSIIVYHEYDHNTGAQLFSYYADLYRSQSVEIYTAHNCNKIWLLVSLTSKLPGAWRPRLWRHPPSSLASLLYIASVWRAAVSKASICKTDLMSVICWTSYTNVQPSTLNSQSSGFVLHTPSTSAKRVL